MNIYTYHYTYRITNLNPVSEEKYYIGIHSADTLDNDYLSSSKYLKESIKQEGQSNFLKEVIEVWDTRQDAEIHEEWLHEAIDVANHPNYYNKRNSQASFTVTTDSINNMTNTIRSSTYARTTKIKAKKNQVKTINDPKWKATIGKKHRQDISKTINSKVWLETKGVEKIKKHLATLNDPNWLDTVGKEKSKKLSIIQNDPNWIKDNTFICQHCNKAMIGKGMFNRWHNDNCRHK